MVGQTLTRTGARWTQIAALASAALGVTAAAPASAVVEIVGTTSVAIGWATVAGPVDGYHVFAEFNGGDPELYGDVPGTQNTIVVEGAYGDAIVIQVAAYDAYGNTGPLSEPSEAIVFVPESAPPPPVPPADGDAVPMDFNGDAHGDVLLHDPTSGETQIWMMNGSLVTESKELPNVFNDQWTVAVTGDFNGDRNADMVFRREDGTIALWLNEGGHISQAMLYEGLGDWTIAAAADLDGDHKSDLIFRHVSGTLFVWFMDGVSIARSVKLGAVPLEWKIAETPDVNGDGRQDLLWRHDTGPLYLWLMNGESIIEGQVVSSPGASWKIVGMPDLDGDHAEEILWRHEAGVLYAWFMDGTKVAAHGSIVDPGPDWQIMGLRDFDGDGRDDFLWEHETGMLYVWFMDGRLLTGGGTVGSTGSKLEVVEQKPGE